jgi:hypothetical protein
MLRTDPRISPVSAVSPGPSRSLPWQPDLPPSYDQAMGVAPPVPLRSVPPSVLEQVANTRPLWTRASARALSHDTSPGGPLPKVVVKELDGHLKQRLRTQRKLDNALGSLAQLEAWQRTADAPETPTLRGGLFDDEEFDVYAMFAAERAVRHYEAKQRDLLSAHIQRMAQLGRRTG